MEQPHPYEALLIQQVEHPTLTWQQPKDPNEIVFSFIDKEDFDSKFDVVPIKYWSAERVTIHNYEELAALVSPFDIIRGGGFDIVVGDMSALDGSPPNALATALWVMHSLDGNARFGTPLAGYPDKAMMVYGTCVITGPADEAARRRLFGLD